MIDPYVTLAGAVVTQAVTDLQRDSRTTDPLLRANAMKSSVDAADFLLRRLWDDTLWLGLLGGSIVRRQVQQRVEALMPKPVRAALKARVRAVGA